MTESDLSGHMILVAEDEYYAATDLRRELERIGAIVIGPAPSLEKVWGLIEAAPRIDGAILDINLGGEAVFPAADLLSAHGVPFLFTTGYDQSVIPPRFSSVPRCEKPVGADKLRRAMARILKDSP